MTVDSYLDWEIIHIGYTRKLFESFIINKVMPKCQPVTVLALPGKGIT